MELFDSSLLAGQNAKPRHLHGVSCAVQNCVYHDSDGFCTADRVVIGSIAAQNVAETRCSTFQPRGEITRRY